MRICLINPRFPLSLWDFSLCRDIDGSRFPFPPLPLATLAALTPSGHEIAVCDENAGPLNLDIDADIIGITGYHSQKERVFELAGLFKARGAIVAIGGPIVRTDNLEECAQHANAVFLGEAEYTWPRFIRDFEAKDIKPFYIQDTFVDMKDSPVPRFDLLDFKAYSSAVIETSRGCPHSCEFCAIPVRLGRGPRTKSTWQVMAEIRALHKLGADSIFIIDDNFLGNRKRAVELLTEIGGFVESIDYGVYFSCQFTIDTACDEDMLGLLEKANFRRVFIGIETPRKESLAAAKKNQNTRVDLVEAVRRIQARNIIVWGAFIVGFDGDDKDIFDEQFRFIQAAAIPVAMLGILQAIPGTPLYERLKAEGRLLKGGTGGITGAAEDLTRTNIKPARMGMEELVSGYGRMARSIYGYGNFARRLVTAIKTGSKNGPVGRGNAGSKEIAAVLRLLKYYLLSPDPRRAFMFLRVVSQTLLWDPRQLRTALVHLVVYKHLRLFYERTAR
ncbi:MAG: DUF4070 domain-containing protein [Actinomycetota bacterium]|nr:DUF4070 domain-containing protein [Nitrospiraceae bacterium]MDA8157182.1 DUF4070 domain-containing protein [Actinomycetota bacterium]